MKRTASIVTGFWIVGCLCLSMAGVVRAAGPAATALDAAPANAQFVVVIPQLADASRQFAGWLSAAGIEVDSTMSDPLGSLKREMGIEAGFNDNGPVLIVLTNLAATQERFGQPDMLLLLPVSDYPAFISNFHAPAPAPGSATSAAVATAGVVEVAMQDGSTGFAKQAGHFAVMGEKRELVEAYQPGGAGGAIAAAMGSAGTAVLDQSDATIYIDMAAAGPALRDMIEEGLEIAGQQAAMAGAPNAGMLNSAMAGYSAAAATVIEGSTALVLGLDISEAGIGISKALRMKEGGELASYFHAGSSQAAQELSRLPANPYIFAAAIDGASLEWAKLAEKLLPPTTDAATRQRMIGLYQGIESAAFAFYAPDQAAMMSGSLMNIAWTLTAEDGPAYLTQLQGYIDAINGTTQPLDPAQPEGPAMSYTASYTPGSLTLDGVRVDQFTIQSQFPPEMMAQMGPAAGFATMFSSYRGYAAATDEHVVITTSADPQSITAILESLDAGEGIGASQAIDDLRSSALPANPAVELYLDLSGVVEFANPFMAMFGAPPITTPDGLPPFAMAMSLDDDTLLGRLYIPTATVRFIADTYRQLEAMQTTAGDNSPSGGPAPY